MIAHKMSEDDLSMVMREGYYAVDRNFGISENHHRKRIFILG